MKWLWTQFLVMIVLLAVSAGDGTMSYFFDHEGTVDNSLAASELDQAVAGQPIDGLLCSAVDEVSTILYSDNLGPTDFYYGFAVENATGTLCGGLVAEVSRGSSTVYTGPLLGLLVGNLDLPAAGNEELLLTLQLAPGATEVGTCQFDTVWLAQQLESAEAPGFNDTETITHFVSGSGTEVGAGCVPPVGTVDLHLSKAISGDSQGYELSDFSYRITGNGFDLIAPHDSYTPLPIGTYTIEEVVPAGFVKEDWRIGWYGQCERGSTFTTTITIEDRHLDFGTLYCQADNQYRPGHGDNTAASPQPLTAAETSAGTTSPAEAESETPEPEPEASAEPVTPAEESTSSRPQPRAPRSQTSSEPPAASVVEESAPTPTEPETEDSTESTPQNTDEG